MQQRSTLLTTSSCGWRLVAGALFFVAISGCRPSAESSSDDLVAAVRSGDKGQVAHILTNGASPEGNADDGRPLFEAILRRDADVARVIVAANARLDREFPQSSNSSLDLLAAAGQTPLRLASIMGDSEIVGELVNRGADVYRLDSEGRSALYFAAREGHVTVAELLSKAYSTQRGAANSELERAPIEAAIRGSHDDVVAVLLDASAANATEKLQGNLTWLHLAASCGREKAAEMLLDHGADVNAKSDRGETALHLAAKDGHEGVVTLLLKRGADWSLK
jgi:ankyrin repeat protein